MPSSKQISSSLLGEFVAHGGSVTCLSFSPKSYRIIATGSEDKKVNLWPVCNKPSNCLASLSGHSSSVESVKFGRNEDIICVGCLDGSLKVWDLESTQILRTFSGHKATVTCLDFHPYGDFFASGSLDANIKLWDTRKKSCMYAYKGHTNDVRSLQFSPDGRWLASGSDEGIIKIWDLAAGKILAEFNDHTGPVTDLKFHPNELLLTSSSMDGTVKFWDLETFNLVSVTSNEAGPMHKIIYNTEGSILYSAARDLLKAYQWEPSRTLDTFVLNWGRIKDLSIDFNSHLLGASCNLMTVAIYFVDLSGNKKSFNSALDNITTSTTKSTNNFLSDFFTSNLTLTSSISNCNLNSLSTSSMKNNCTTINNTSNNLLSSPSLNNLTCFNGTTFNSNGSGNVSSYFQSYPLSMPMRLPPITTSTVTSKINNNNNKVNKNNYTNQQQHTSITSASSTNNTFTTNTSVTGTLTTPVTSNSHHILHDNQGHIVHHHYNHQPQHHLHSNISLNPKVSSNSSSSSSPINYDTTCARQTKSSLVFVEANNIKSINQQQQQQFNINGKNNNTNVTCSPMATVTSIQQHLHKSKLESDSTSLPLQLFPTNGKDLHLNDNDKQQAASSNHLSWSRLPPHIPSVTVAPECITKSTLNQSSVTNGTSKINNHQVNNVTTGITGNSDGKLTVSSSGVVVVTNTCTTATSTCTTTTTTLSQGKAAAIVFPEPQRKRDTNNRHVNTNDDDMVDQLIPETRDCPAGLDIDDFLPKHLQDTLRLGLNVAPEISETEAMTCIMRGHKSLVTALAHRKKKIQIVLALWSSKDSVKALEQAVQLDDQSVIVDILNIINLKASLWNLDVCQTLLPVIHDLLQSKYECYMSVGCTSLKLILKNFASMIKSNITAPPSIGVDISRDERYNKCISCYNHLLNVRAFILKRQTLQGKLGRSFRELSILMQTLE